MTQQQSTQDAPADGPHLTTAREKRIAAHRARVMPLDQLPRSMQEKIAAQVAAPVAPPRWLQFVGCSMESRAWYEWHWARGIDPLGKREPLPYGLRAAIIARDGYVCQICGGDVDQNDVHIDHIHPYSKGGRHAFDNLQVTHSRCNMRKGAKA